jgi:threonyl-tRNA synthetase
MVDLCIGPHIPHTGKIKAFMVTKVSGFETYSLVDESSHLRFQSSASYFLGDSNNDSLQRVYGISFPDKKQMTDYKAFLAEAAKRDHRKIGKVRCLIFRQVYFISSLCTGAGPFLL